METLTRNVNSLIEKTLEMKNEKDLKTQQEIGEAMNPLYQSQPLPGYDCLEEEEEEPEKIPDIYPTENSIAKRQKVRYLATGIKYSPTRVKSRNFLSNIGYTSVNKWDFYNENFILDVFILLVKNLNPFPLQRKISDKFKHEMIYMTWRECIPAEFYRYICQEENLRYLNGRDVSQPGVLEIAGRFIDRGKENLRVLQKCLATYKNIFQYVYSHTFPEIYAMSEKQGIDIKSNFHILFKTYKDKHMLKTNS